MNSIDNIILNEFPSEEEVEQLLVATWGNLSPLSKKNSFINNKDCLQALEDNAFEKIYNKSLALGIYHENKQIACAQLKILPWHEVEISGIAISPSYRGKGLMRFFYAWYQKVTPYFLRKGFLLSEYATIGSPIMYTVEKLFNYICQKEPYITNILPYAIYAEEQANYQHRFSSEYSIGMQKLQLNSTFQALMFNSFVPSCEKEITEKTMLDRVISDKPHHYQAAQVSQTSNNFSDTPHNFLIVTINNNNINELDKIMNDLRKNFGNKIYLIRIPLLNKFSEVTDRLIHKYTAIISGITLLEQCYAACFLVNSPGDVLQLFQLLSTDKKLGALSNLATELLDINLKKRFNDGNLSAN